MTPKIGKFILPIIFCLHIEICFILCKNKEAEKRK